MPSGEEIQASLRAFAERWGEYAGSERGEAQTFLNEMFACYGTDRRDVGAKFEDFVTSAGFLDLHWPGICIVEMKAPTRPVSDAQPQLERYWRESSKPDEGIGAARWVILCNFRQVEIWEPGRFPTRAVTTFDLADLPDRYDTLAFLAGPHVEPNFNEHYRELTREAAKVVAGVYQSLADRAAALQRDLQRFILQSVWCMFADDLQMMDDFPFQATLNKAAADPDNSAALIGYLFTVLNQKTDANRTGLLAGTRYVNGELFAEPAYVQLNRDEIRRLLDASAFDWRKVDPTIFGSLMEGVLGRERRWELGAHYTHEVDIMKIVGPTIVRPWRERIAATTTPQQARDLLDELCAFKVLDPACGCGNFLYVAYRELRGLEHELKLRIQHLGAETGLPVPGGDLPYYPLRNVQGIDLERAAVQIARVTLWMGHRQMIERYGEAEPALPLQDLSGIQQADALRVDWPETDCIIGNPPFMGAKRIRPSLGDDYADWLSATFGVGVKDLCTYWFRLAHEHLGPDQRAGLVGTNSIRQTGGRQASLQYIVDNGGVVTDAISTQEWPGDAKVHVSLANWIKSPSQSVTRFTLDGEPVWGLSSQLRAVTGVTRADPAPLAANVDRCFAGVVPQAKGFFLAADEARRLQADPAERPVVTRFLTGEDITSSPDQGPSRWIIDFRSMPLEEAMRCPKALALVRDRVRPERERSKNRAVEKRWWLFGRRVEATRVAIDRLRRYAAAASTGKRLTLSWQDRETVPNNAVAVFAFDDDYSMGVLLSRAHGEWAWARSSTLKGDLRYTSAAVFMTFAWPDPVTDAQRERVAEASRRLLARRTEICTTENIGLTKLYNAVDEGAWTDLKALHRELDEAVVDCYGWPRSAAQDAPELVRLLTERNREIVEDGRAYDPFGSAGGAVGGRT